MKQRKLIEVDIVANKYPALRLPIAYVDRLRAEGVEKVDVVIEDETGVLTICPQVNTGKTRKENEEGGK